MQLYIVPFFSSFALAASLIIFFLLVPSFNKRRWRSGDRHADRSNVSRLGGIAIMISFVAACLLDPNLVITKAFVGLFTGAAFIFLFGLWDDLFELGWKAQIFFQIGLSALVFIFGVRILSLTNPFGGAWVFPSENFILPGFLLIFIWLFLVMNAVNWLDGLDGLCGGVILITLLTIFFLSLKPEVNQPPIALISMIGAGAVAGFLFFNIHPARIFAGTTGSMFLGFLIGLLAIIAGTKIATALLVLALPIADALWVIGERLREGKSIFQPDQRHLHFKLRELGWSDRKIAGFFSLVTAGIAIVALNTQALGKLFAIILVLAIIFSLLLYIDRKTKKSVTSPEKMTATV